MTNDQTPARPAAIVRGRVWKFGDYVRGDDGILPFEAVRDFTAIDEKRMGELCMTPLDPDFPKKVQPGDVIVAGRYFGAPTTHEQSVIALKQCGVGAVLADDFGTRFYRWCIDAALPVVMCKGIAGQVAPGDELEVDLASGLIRDLTTGVVVQATPLPDSILEVIAMGGLMPYLKQKLVERGAVARE